jgi:hypothetical protein
MSNSSSTTSTFLAIFRPLHEIISLGSMISSQSGEAAFHEIAASDFINT